MTTVVGNIFVRSFRSFLGRKSAAGAATVKSLRAWVSEKSVSSYPLKLTMNAYQPGVNEDGSYPHLDLSGKVIIKAQLGDDIRRIPIHNEDITYDELVLMMQRVFRGKLSTNDDIMVKYKDEDGDLITIFDNSDLSFAIHCSRILKLTLFVNGHPKPLESSEVQYIKQELREVRDKILSLMDRLEPPSAGLTNSTETEKMKVKQHQQMNANKATNNIPPKEFDPLTINKGSLEENAQTKVMSSFGIQEGGKGDEHRAGTPDSISSLGSSVSQQRPATTPQVPSGQVTPQPVYQPGQSHGHGQIQYPSPQTVQTQQQPQQPQQQQQQIYPGQPQYPSQQPPTPAQGQQIPVAKAGYATPTSQAGQGYPQAGQSYPGYPPQQQQTAASVGPQQNYPQAQAGFPPASMAQSYPPTSTYSQTTGIQYTQPQSQYQSPYPPQGVPPTAQANPYSRGTTPTGYPRPTTAYPQGYQ